MKKRIKYFFVMLILMLVPFVKVNAITLSKNDLTIEKGGTESVEMYVNTDDEIISVTFTLVFSTYDIPAYFSPSTGFNDTNPNGITHEVIFDAAKTGKVTIGTVVINVVNEATDTTGAVNIHTVTAKTASGNTVNLKNQDINVKVGTPVKEKPKSALLSKIESKLVKIDLKKDTYEYTVDVKKSEKELDLKAIPEDEKAKVEISTQKIEELQDNKIIITVKNGSEEKKYTIKVNVLEEDNTINETTVDKREFKENKSYKIKWILIATFLVIALVVSLVLNKRK